jgi:hypothetical protein
MRVLPFAVLNLDAPNFHTLARDIMANTVITHGHPRALIGALVTGYIQWFALRLERTLEYGELIDTLLESCNQWSSIPDITSCWGGWLGRAENSVPGYTLLWNNVVAEQLNLLRGLQAALKAGAIALER